MNVLFNKIRFIAAGLCLTLAAGGGGGDDGGGGGGAGGAPPVAVTIGAAGGTVTSPGGAQVVVPAGALAQNTAIAVTQSSAGAPALPAGLTAFGQMFAFTPHGTTFAVPVTITLPFDLKSVPAGSTPAVYKTNAQNQWEHVPTATFKADSLSAAITSFSDLQVVIPPLSSAPPVRVWSFREYRTDALEEVEVVSDTQIGGHLDELFDFGPAAFDPAFLNDDGTTVPADGIATGTINSTADGVTYWVGTSAPIGIASDPIANPELDEPIGSKARLVQYQTFTKNATNATYEFTLTDAFIDLRDGNSSLSRECPPAHDVLLGAACDLIKGEVYLDVQAFTDDPNTPKTIFFRTAGGATVNGGAVPNAVNEAGVSWITSAWNEAFSRTPLWTTENFNFATQNFNGPEGVILMRLEKPRTYTVDISSVEVRKAFTVKVVTYAFTYDRASKSVSGKGTEFPTAANAFLRDPSSIGGTTITTTGLTPINTPLPLVDPVEVPVAPAACVPGPGPDPAAGVLQFSAASYTLGESSSTPTITVTRTGGSSGAVTATFTTSNGSAVAGADYTPVNATVFFADGDAVSRVVGVPIIQDLINESDKTVNLRLSQPGGCAALGAQVTAVLTIRDDDSLPPAPSGLDTGFGIGGKVTTLFGGNDTAMALQRDGKIVMVGGSTTHFVLARYNPNGSLDAGFGVGGLVSTNMVGGFVQVVANGVAIQADGKIVVVGFHGLGRFTFFALARYNTDGSLDESFGSAGKVTDGVTGRAFAVAIQPADGKIVVAGDESLDRSPNDAAKLARYSANGSLDASFGGVGTVTTDFIVARNIVLQPNGAIVVSGDPPSGASAGTGVARYSANGSLDGSFGVGGKVTLGGTSVGEGLARQSDGKFVLVGNVQVGAGSNNVTQFQVRRLLTDGSPDNAFGNGGFVNTAFTTQQDAAQAVTLQGDGKIVVSGRSGLGGNNFALARYNADGTLDTGFLGSGKTTIAFFGLAASAENVAVQPDGKIVLGGFARNNVDGYALARINP